MRSYHLNAVGPALLIKHFVPLLSMGQRVVYAKLSARVGSISDNHKGGWYGYRAAKAGLNMLLQTAAIECARKRPELVMAALQPGTVASALSQPFVASSDAITPDVSVAGLLQALDALPAQGRAHFVDYRGQSIAW
jgi:NAD(P)-dependent dehydrogenase (short-subunit alcohol dehydrogenase family)